MYTLGKIINHITNDIYLAVLVSVFLHFYADFKMQITAKLDKMKQWRWWRDECFKCFDNPNEARHAFLKYHFDYLCALLIHGFMWSFVTFLPFLTSPSSNFIAIVLVNGFIHAVIDDLKANKRFFPLWTDQFMHILTIGVTYYSLW